MNSNRACVVNGTGGTGQVCREKNTLVAKGRKTGEML